MAYYYYWAIELPHYFTSAPHFSHTQMRIKAKVYFGRPHTVRIMSFSSTRRLADSRAPRPRASNLRPHSSVAECTLTSARRNGMQKVMYTRAFRLLLLIGNVLNMDSKTKPTSKLKTFTHLQIRTRVQNETSFRHLRAMNEHDETALTAFSFLYSILTKNIDAYSSSVIIKYMQLISLV